MTEIVVLTGPPCSGKSSHVDDHAGPLDVVIDLDRIAHALGYPHPHIDWAPASSSTPAGSDTPTPGEHPPPSSTPHPSRAAAMRARASLIKAALDDGFSASCVWIIDTVLSEIAVARYQRAGARIVRLDPGPDECHRRATAAGRSDATHDQIDQWYGNLGTTSTDW